MSASTYLSAIGLYLQSFAVPASTSRIYTLRTCLLSCTRKSSVMAVLGCNGLRCVINIILSFSLACTLQHTVLQPCTITVNYVCVVTWSPGRSVLSCVIMRTYCSSTLEKAQTTYTNILKSRVTSNDSLRFHVQHAWRNGKNDNWCLLIL